MDGTRGKSRRWSVAMAAFVDGHCEGRGGDLLTDRFLSAALDAWEGSSSRRIGEVLVHVVAPDSPVPFDVARWTATVPGLPVAKGRPRFGKGRTYTPQRTRAWGSKASEALAVQWGHGDPLAGPAVLRVRCYMPRPQRLTWKRKPMPREPHMGTPDSDNLLKAVADALEKAGVVVNDSQFWRVELSKEYASGDEPPHVAVEVTW